MDKEEDVSGYYTVAKRLKDYVLREGLPSADQLASIDRQACARILDQDIRNLHMEELMDMFAFSLRGLGQWVSLGPTAQSLAFSWFMRTPRVTGLGGRSCVLAASLKQGLYHQRRL